MDCGKRFLEFRAKYGLTQNELADIIGITAVTIHRTEYEKTKPTKRNEIIYEKKMKEWEEKKNARSLEKKSYL